ncbi:hypothetical protein, partial [Nocardia farcinica]|uniref:hypothetical protein n=1 Tax=Nocardia farcinica TaxID=37329 RepID=UPI00245835FC
ARTSDGGPAGIGRVARRSGAPKHGRQRVRAAELGVLGEHDIARQPIGESEMGDRAMPVWTP